MGLSSKSGGSYFSPDFFQFLKGLARNNNREWLAHTLWRTLGPLAGHSSGYTGTCASPRTRVPTRPMWPWSSGTGEEEKSLTPGYTFTWHLGRVLRVRAFGILTPRHSKRSGGPSCHGPRLGD